MTRAESKFVVRSEARTTNFDSVPGHSAVLTTAARVHLGAFDGHYYSEDHKFQNKSRSLTFVLTYFVRTD